MRVASFPPVIPENPYQRLLYEALAGEGFELVDIDLEAGPLLRRQVDVLHFHWPQGYWRHGRDGASALGWPKLALLGARLALARARGVRVAWTVHQALPHERPRPRLDRAGALLLARAANVLIAHDRASAVQAAEILRVPVERFAIVPHGSYDGTYPPGRDRAAVRAELGLADDDVALLCFGHLRTYKGTEQVLDALGDAPAQAVLVVAGLVLEEEIGARLRAGAARENRIRLLLDFIPDERVRELFEAADVAVCPRPDGGTSGALALALDMGLPVVAADRPAYVELAGGEQAGWWFAPGDRGSIAATITRAVEASPAERAARGAAGRAAAERRGWPAIARATAGLLRGAGARR